MGACASVPKSMKAELAADVPAPEQPKEEIPAAETAEVTTSDKKAEDGDDKHEIKAVEVEEPSKVEVENSKTDAPVEAAPVATTIEEEKKKEVADKK